MISRLASTFLFILKIKTVIKKYPSLSYFSISLCNTDIEGNAIPASSVIVPSKYALESAYPNPFNPVTTLNFSLPESQEVILQVYNLQGRVIETLVNSNIEAGYHSVQWNGDNYSSGMYFVKMVAGEYVNTQKLMLVK